MNAFIITVVNLFWVLLLLITSFYARATVSLEVDCPIKFIGRVEKVFTPKSPQNHLVKNDVFFKVTKSISGGQESEMVITVLKYGPYKFVTGESYHVSMNGKYLCSTRMVER